MIRKARSSAKFLMMVFAPKTTSFPRRHTLLTKWVMELGMVKFFKEWHSRKA